MNKVKVAFILFFISFISFSQTQKEIDFYKSKFFQMEKIGSDSTLYYTEKIFSSKQPINLAFAYTAKRQILFLTGKEYNDTDYINKINFYLKEVPNERKYFVEIAKIYNINANTFFNKKSNKQALNYYFKALDYAYRCNDIKLIVKIKSNIVVIKGDNDLEKEAIIDLISLRDLLISNKTLYLKEEFEKQLFLNNINLGVYYSKLYKKENNKVNYNKSEHYLNLALNSVNEENINKAIVYKNLGSLKTISNENNQSIVYYKKALEIYKKNNFINEVYYIKKNIAIDYYNLGKKNLAKPIFLENVKQYDPKLIPEDYYLYNLLYLSKIYEDEKKQDSMAYFSKAFFESYNKKTNKGKLEFVEVLSKIKENDIKKLKNNVNDLNNKQGLVGMIYLVVLISIISIMTILVIKQIKLRKRTEKKIEDLIESIKKKNNNQNDNQVNLNIIKDIKEKEILSKLIKLENTNYFLRSDFDRYNVAKKIDSNTTYLSLVINNYKKMTFNEYTNDLRINYVLKALLEDSKLRGYTMQAIAESIGYKNGISFSKIFKEKTGITPYQFIEKINKGK